MKMTREQVAELLLKANKDLSNVEMLCFGGNYLKIKALDVIQILQDIIDGAEFRIKDNAVKEVTPALRGKWVRHKKDNVELPIQYLDYKEQKIGINDFVLELERFNEFYELVED